MQIQIRTATQLVLCNRTFQSRHAVATSHLTCMTNSEPSANRFLSSGIATRLATANTATPLIGCDEKASSFIILCSSQPDLSFLF